MLDENIDYYILEDHFDPDADFIDYLQDIVDIVYKIVDEASDVVNEATAKVNREEVDSSWYLLQVKEFIKKNSIYNGK